MAYDCPRPSRRAVMAATRVLTGWQVNLFVGQVFLGTKIQTGTHTGCVTLLNSLVCAGSHARVPARASRSRKISGRAESVSGSPGAPVARGSHTSARSRRRRSPRVRASGPAHARETRTDARRAPCLSSRAPTRRMKLIPCGAPLSRPLAAQQRRSRRRGSLPPAAPSARVPRRARASIRPRVSPAYPRAPPRVR